MNTLKQIIKEKAQLQREYKNQRKTVHIVGERTMDASQATNLHSYNRSDLRRLYIAYAILRGKDPVLSVGNYDTNDAWDVKAVTKIVDQYASEFRKETVHTDEQ